MNAIKLMFKYLSILLALILGIGTHSASAQNYMTESGYVEFNSSVPLHSFTGKSDYLVGKISLSDSVVDFYVDVATLKTGIGKRDRDMLSTLEAEKYPFASFYGKIKSDVQLPEGKPTEVTAEGDFKVHGVSKEKSISGTIEKTPEGLQLNASWTINMKDYDIRPPGILFYRVDETIDVTISALLKPTE